MWFNFVNEDGSVSVEYVDSYESLLPSEISDIVLDDENGIVSFRCDGQYFYA